MQACAHFAARERPRRSRSAEKRRFATVGGSLRSVRTERQRSGGPPRAEAAARAARKSRKPSPQDHPPERHRVRAARRKPILRSTTESARLVRAANRSRRTPDRKNWPQPAERHSYSSSSKCHNLIRPRAAAARRRKNASSNQHDNPSPMIKRYDPQRNLRCLRPFRE